MLAPGAWTTFGEALFAPVGRIHWWAGLAHQGMITDNNSWLFLGFAAGPLPAQLGAAAPLPSGAKGHPLDCRGCRAGSEVAHKWPGYFEGAVIAGEEVAETLSGLLKA